MKHIAHFSFNLKAIRAAIFQYGMDGRAVRCEPAYMNDIRATPLRDLPRFVPPHLFFVGSAIFHYLGPAGAVLLFAHIAPAGVAWLRIVSAAIVFAAWRRPWRVIPRIGVQERVVVVALGVVLAAMNMVFYFALARLPLGTVAAIEFLGPVSLAAWGMRTSRNVLALALVVTGVALLTRVHIVGDLPGYAFAFANCALFVLYVMLGHRIASDRVASGIDLLAMAMAVAAVIALPLGFVEAAPAFSSIALLGAAIAVGVCSSVIPYVCDQLAMARLPRASFALMLSLLPATAAIIGIVVLHQLPTQSEAAGIAVVIVGVALHRTREAV
ncbi:EamA family transporter [Burkholderia cenocepacia]|uniref:EamA family transporter n=1 Tax=Burkholderia cenocepacia TaxID=95486 RepID=UPI00285C6857|nr:EamA family transporter [Burkholderia cenocepacia]MDR5646439.1 EamA family transporter [Burkholderia cenocepacia]